MQKIKQKNKTKKNSERRATRVKRVKEDCKKANYKRIDELNILHEIKASWDVYLIKNESF